MADSKSLRAERREMNVKDSGTYKKEKAPLSFIQWLNQQKLNEHLLCFRHRDTVGKMRLHRVYSLVGESDVNHRSPQQI